MKRRDWENMSNSRIKENLSEVKNEHQVIKDKISKLLENALLLEKEYAIGDNIINKRMKGIE